MYFPLPPGKYPLVMSQIASVTVYAVYPLERGYPRTQFGANIWTNPEQLLTLAPNMAEYRKLAENNLR